jgi:rhamnosyltransferase
MINREIGLRRLGVFHWYNHSGKVYGYVRKLVEFLNHYCQHVVIIANGYTDDDAIAYFRSNSSQLICRENKGFDFGAYKEFFTDTDDTFLRSFDELILLNSSVFGPFFPMDTLFTQFENDPTCDFWGISESQIYQISESAKQILGEQHTPLHLNSYFLVFKKPLFTSLYFKDFFRDLPKIMTYNDAVYYGEFRLTKFFTDHGFRYKALVYRNDFDGKYFEESYTLNYGFMLISKYRIPFIKVKYFLGSYNIFFENGINNFFSYVRNKTTYPVNLLYDYIGSFPHSCLQFNNCDEFLSDFYIYGVGNIGTQLFHYFLEKEITPKGFLVSDGHKTRDVYYGIPIQEISAISVASKPNIIVAIANAVPIKNNLARLGFDMRHVI